MRKYSIILPVRNGGVYVKACVNSILSQTYKDFDFIILDNYSTDGTLQWLQSLTDNRIKIITSDRSLTIEENWARIVAVEKNEFMTLIGHDDILYPEFLEIIDQLIKTNPQVSLYHTHFNFINANGDIIRSAKAMQNHMDAYEFLKAFLTNSIDTMGTGYVMRSNDYNEIQGIPSRYPNLLFADFELWLNLAFKNSVMVAPQKCFSFRIHKSMTTTSSDKKIHQALEIFFDFLYSIMKKDAKATAIIHEYASQFLLFYTKGLAHRLLRTPLIERNQWTVEDFINYSKRLATKLSIQNKYKPERIFTLRVAKVIDNHVILRKLYLLFKKIYAKPILKS